MNFFTDFPSPLFASQHFSGNIDEYREAGSYQGTFCHYFLATVFFCSSFSHA